VGRPLRQCVGGLIYHVLNRANAGLQLFDHAGDYEAFERVVSEAHRRTPMRVLSYCLMPNHWHLVLWPRDDGDLSRFLHWTTLTHTQRWHAHRGSVGGGHVYQGRFKSFVLEENEPFLVVCRYVERNALSAGLVVSAEEWRWCSLWRRRHENAEGGMPLADWPVPRPPGWVNWVNLAQTQKELEILRDCIRRGRPFGSDAWLQSMARRFDLQMTSRPRGRPRKKVSGTFSAPNGEKGS